jgi:phage shock protein A
MTLNRIEALIDEAERRKRFLEQGLEALRETLNEATDELQKLRANAEVLPDPALTLNPNDPRKRIERTN